jgi:hypothetical protein
MSGILGFGPNQTPITPDDLRDATAAPVRAPLGDVLGASASDAFQTGPGVGLFRSARRAQWDAGTAEFDPELGLPPPPSRLLQPDEANTLYGIEGHLRFTEPLSEQSATELRDLKRAEIARRDVLARAESGFAGWTARAAVSLVAGAADPLNLASAFVPVVGQVRAQAMLAAQATRAGRAMTQARIGAIEGAVGQALLEPVNQFVASREQRDYDMADSLLNVAFGAALGGLLQGGGRALVDGWRGWRPDVPRAVVEETHEAAVRVAAAQMARGEPVHVDPLVRTAREYANAEAAFFAFRPVRTDFGPGGVAANESALAALPPSEQLPVPWRYGEEPPMLGGRGEVGPVAPDAPGGAAAEIPGGPARVAGEAQQQVGRTAAPPAWQRGETFDTMELAPANLNEPPPPGADPAMPTGPDVPPGSPPPAPRGPGGGGEPGGAAALPPAPPEAPRPLGPAAAEVGRVERPADAAALASAQAARARADGGARLETPVGRLDAQAADLDARLAETDAILRQQIEAGRLTEADLRALDMTDETTRAQERMKGIEAAAACLIANGA